MTARRFVPPLLTVSLGVVLGLGCAGRLDPLAAGDAAMGRADYAQAQRAYAEAVRRTPSSMVAWRSLARAHFRAGALPEADVAIARALALAPDDVAALLLRGQIRMNSGDRGAALVDARRVAERAEDARELQEVAVLLLRLGQEDAALQAAATAVSRSRGAAAVYNNFAVLAVEAHRPELAARVLAEGLAEHPNDLALARAQAALFVTMGDFDAAARAYTRLRDRDPRPGLVDQALALIHHRRGALDLALRHAQSAVDAEGTARPDVHYTLVVILRDLGRPQDAARALRTARRRFPADPDLTRLTIPE